MVAVFDLQLEARANWALFETCGDTAYSEIALSLAEQSGFSGDEKTGFMKSQPSLSEAFDLGAQSSLDEWEERRPYSNQGFRRLRHEWAMPGQCYLGPIVDVTEDKIFQTVEVGGRALLILHWRNHLSSSESAVFSSSGSDVRVHYVRPGMGVVKMARPSETPGAAVLRSFPPTREIVGIIDEMYGDSCKRFPTYDGVVFTDFCSNMLDQFGDDELSPSALAAFSYARAAYGYMSPCELHTHQEEQRAIGICRHGLDTWCCPAGCGE